MNRSMTPRSSTCACSCCRREGVAGAGDHWESPAPPRRDKVGPGELGGPSLPSSAGRRIGPAVAEESPGGLACLALDLPGPRLLDRVRTELRGQQGLDLQLLLGGEREQLVGRLLRLERSFGALARGDDLGGRLGIVAYVRDDAVLDVHRLAECRHRTVKLAACPCDALVAGEASVEAVWKQLAIALVELIDAEADALRLAHQP